MSLSRDSSETEKNSHEAQPAGGSQESRENSNRCYSIEGIRIIICSDAGEIVEGSHKSKENHSEIFSSDEINRGETLRMQYHPLSGDRLATLSYDGASGRYKKVTSGDAGWMEGNKVTMLNAIGDGDSHTREDLSQGLRHWNYNPWTGEDLRKAPGSL